MYLEYSRVMITLSIGLQISFGMSYVITAFCVFPLEWVMSLTAFCFSKADFLWNELCYLLPFAIARQISFGMSYVTYYLLLLQGRFPLEWVMSLTAFCYHKADFLWNELCHLLPFSLARQVSFGMSYVTYCLLLSQGRFSLEWVMSLTAFCLSKTDFLWNKLSQNGSEC
jgi:hypothetical protein